MNTSLTFQPARNAAVHWVKYLTLASAISTLGLVSGCAPDINLAPQWESDAKVIRFDDQPLNYQAVAQDPDGPSVSYRISGGKDAALFAINENTGQLSFINAFDAANPIDSGQDNIYELILRASDPAGGYDDLKFTVEILGNAVGTPQLVSPVPNSFIDGSFDTVDVVVKYASPTALATQTLMANGVALQPIAGTSLWQAQLPLVSGSNEISLTAVLENGLERSSQSTFTHQTITADNAPNLNYPDFYTGLQHVPLHNALYFVDQGNLMKKDLSSGQLTTVVTQAEISQMPAAEFAREPIMAGFGVSLQDEKIYIFIRDISWVFVSDCEDDCGSNGNDNESNGSDSQDSFVSDRLALISAPLDSPADLTFETEVMFDSASSAQVHYLPLKNSFYLVDFLKPLRNLFTDYGQSFYELSLTDFSLSRDEALSNTGEQAFSVDFDDEFLFQLDSSGQISFQNYGESPRVYPLQKAETTLVSFATDFDTATGKAYTAYSDVGGFSNHALIEFDTEYFEYRTLKEFVKEEDSESQAQAVFDISVDTANAMLYYSTIAVRPQEGAMSPSDNTYFQTTVAFSLITLTESIIAYSAAPSSWLFNIEGLGAVE